MSDPVKDAARGLGAVISTAVDPDSVAGKRGFVARNHPDIDARCAAVAALEQLGADPALRPRVVAVLRDRVERSCGPAAVAAPRDLPEDLAAALRALVRLGERAFQAALER